MDSLFRCLLCYNFEKHKITRACVILSLHKKCPYSDLLWSAFSRIRAKYGKIGNICQYSVRKQENADQNNFWQSSKATSRNTKWDKTKLIMGGGGGLYSLKTSEINACQSWILLWCILNGFEGISCRQLKTTQNYAFHYRLDKRRERVFAACLCLFLVSFCLEIDFF